MTHYGISSEIRRLIGLSIICIIIGLLLDHVLIALAVGGLLYIAYHLRNLQRLLKCLQGRRLAGIPEASGLWGQVFDHLSRLKRREIRETPGFVAGRRHRERRDAVHRTAAQRGEPGLRRGRQCRAGAQQMREIGMRGQYCGHLAPYAAAWLRYSSLTQS